MVARAAANATVTVAASVIVLPHVDYTTNCGSPTAVLKEVVRLSAHRESRGTSSKERKRNDNLKFIPGT